MSLLNPRKFVLAAALFHAALPVAATETWGELDCLVVDDFIAVYEALRAADLNEKLLSDRNLLERTLRGTNYSAFEKIQDQLSPVPDPNFPRMPEGEQYKRMLALFRDRCS